MKQKIHFTKMHGAGNDYIYVNTLLYNIDDPSELARLWSDRHKGIGSDGLVLIGRSPIPEADYSMRIFNADGSEAMMCGNACRCIGKYLYEKGLTNKKEIRLLTLSGVKVLDLHVKNAIVESVTVDMGEPVFENETQFNPVGIDLPRGCFVGMGNPHYVVFVGDVEHTTSNLPKCVLTAFGFAFGSAEVVSRWLVAQEPAPWLWQQRRQDGPTGRAASSWTAARSMSNGESKTIMSILLALRSSCLKEKLICRNIVITL